MDDLKWFHPAVLHTIHICGLLQKYEVVYRVARAIKGQSGDPAMTIVEALKRQSDCIVSDVTTRIGAFYTYWDPATQQLGANIRKICDITEMENYGAGSPEAPDPAQCFDHQEGASSEVNPRGAICCGSHHCH